VLVTDPGFIIPYDHAALYIARGGSSDSGSDTGFLYDPAGFYARANDGGTGAFITGDKATPQGFTNYHEQNGDTVKMVCKNTTLEEEKRLAEKVRNMPYAEGFQCARSVSDVLAGSPAFPEVDADTFWPGDLYRDAGR
jgi:hypothetical protein